MKIFIDTLKKKVVPVGELFNIKYKNPTSQTDTFHMRNKITVKKDGATITGSCNGIPVTCNAGKDFQVTADQPIKINEIYNDCDYKTMKSDKDEVSRLTLEVAEVEGLAEATYGYSQMTGTDITSKIASKTSALEEIAEGIKEVTSKGYNRKDLIIALDEIYALDLEMADLSCCDFAIRTSKAKDVLAKKTGVKMVMAVPRDVLSGNFDEQPLTPRTTVKFRVYVKDYALLKDFCRAETVIRSAGGNYAKATQVIGEYQIGFGLVDNEAEAHAYYEVTPPPAPAGQKQEMSEEQLAKAIESNKAVVEELEAKEELTKAEKGKLTKARNFLEANL